MAYDSDKPMKPDYRTARVMDLKGALEKRRRGKRTRPKAAFLKPRSKHPFVMQVPLAWLQILRDAQAMTALPLLLAIDNRMIVKRTSSVSITARIWAIAEARSEQERRTMLRALERVPGLVRLEKRKRLSSWYRAHRGPLWDAEFSYDRLNAIEDHDSED
jgi:hypothetical protein